MKNLPIVLSVLVAALVIGGAIVLGQKPQGTHQVVQNVSMEGERQIIEIDAKGGYFPKLTTAKAGVPTVVRLKTSGTYDCSSAVTIPSLGFRKNLDATGITEVEVPIHVAQGTLEGTCTMGMYSFSVRFL
ncbi:MAG: cupredoxin domain-containing protein [bacterium]|nr:cupredoxin domain-containing protein [bacterium]